MKSGSTSARSADKILDLNGIVRELGQYGRNMVIKKKAIAPTWIVVTSQEKLDEVVAAIDSKRVELAKFRTRSSITLIWSRLIFGRSLPSVC